MFWTFILMGSLASALIQLGSTSATVGFLTLGLQMAGVLVVILALLLLWKSWSTRGRDHLV